MCFVLLDLQWFVHRANCVRPTLSSPRLKCSRSCCVQCRARRFLRMLCLHILSHLGTLQCRRPRGCGARCCHHPLQPALCHRRLRHALRLRHLGILLRRSRRHRVPRVQLRRCPSTCQCWRSRQRHRNRLLSRLLLSTFRGARNRSPRSHQRAECTLASARCHRCC